MRFVVGLIVVLSALVGCGGSSIAGTWSSQPSGVNPQSTIRLTLDLKSDGTCTGKMSGAGLPDRTMKGTYVVEGKTITVTATEAEGKPVPKGEALVGTFADDMKSFEVPLIGKFTKK